MLFKHIKDNLIVPLTTIFNQLLSVATVPEKGNRAIIIPVFIKDAADKLSNYRPISLSCVSLQNYEARTC
jgi:hypothetical protein